MIYREDIELREEKELASYATKSKDSRGRKYPEEEHLHFHVVPRWVGDTNYMPVLGETKVVSHYLSELLSRLKGSF